MKQLKKGAIHQGASLTCIDLSLFSTSNNIMQEENASTSSQTADASVNDFSFTPCVN
ncbi:Hypothetical protein CINCED_3A000646 [Cinara cedri]|uniref:Uncharacterized protein n=1 Tax=Cinara cedri TaxID=506608 RepID=A0A5E4MA77_9HEMI|nr:Hypothetical protein CINCED_3A000646 [Cinara cedri]